MIRAAVEADIPRMVEMGLRFHRESSYKETLAANPEQMRTLCVQLLSGHGLLVSERDGELVGMIGFFISPHFISGESAATECFWWVEPEYRGEGIRLMREAEKFARSSGATKMMMIAPTDQVANVYERLGYDFVEYAYQKSL